MPPATRQHNRKLPPGKPWHHQPQPACAAFLTGSLAGLILGIPRNVSSGEVRFRNVADEARQNQARQANKIGHRQADEAAQLKADEAEQDDAEAGKGGWTAESQKRFAPSTNLAEISDWLTKLLLGAGLVELGRLGRPLTELINNVARGLGGPSAQWPCLK